MAADESTPVPGTEETPPEAPAQERTLTAKLKPVNKAPVPPRPPTISPNRGAGP